MAVSVAEVSVIVGSGGVGKTTLVSVRALSSAMSGRKTLAMTFDPSLRLKDILNLEVKESTQNLEVFLIDPKKIFEHLLGRLESKEEQEELLQNKLFQNLLTRIVGVQEFTSLYYLTQKMSEDYDFIYVDTPPFQNALEFFDGPQKLRRLFESKVLDLFLESQAEGLFKSFIKSSSRIALKTLKGLTGLDFFKQLLDFINILEKVRPIVLQTLNQAEEAFANGQIQVDYVGLYKADNIHQAEDFISEIVGRGLHLKSYYLSKYVDVDAIDLKTIESHRVSPVLSALMKNQAQEAQKSETLLKKLSSRYKLDMIRVPYFRESEDLKDIARNWNGLTKKT